jgi:hypothetical protein
MACAVGKSTIISPADKKRLLISSDVGLSWTLDSLQCHNTGLYLATQQAKLVSPSLPRTIKDKIIQLDAKDDSKFLLDQTANAFICYFRRSAPEQAWNNAWPDDKWLAWVCYSVSLIGLFLCSGLNKAFFPDTGTRFCLSVAGQTIQKAWDLVPPYMPPRHPFPAIRQVNIDPLVAETIP